MFRTVLGIALEGQRSRLSRIPGTIAVGLYHFNGLYLQNLSALLAVPLFVLYINRWQIMPEERALSARFPEAYAAFRQRVWRWL